MRFVLLLLALALRARAFVPQARTSNSHRSFTASTTHSSLFAKRPAKRPTFNKETQKWERASDDDGVYPYGVWGSFLRQGTAPVLARVLSPENYEQSVLKYMAGAGVDRAEATANMDAMLFNPADWAYQKMEEKNGAPKVDYGKLKMKQAVLIVVWALFITPLSISVIWQTVEQATSH